MKRFFRNKIFLSIVAGTLLALGAIFVCNLLVANNERFVFEEANAVPYSKTALVLGTAPTLLNGNPNVYFTARIKAATELYQSGNIGKIIVSGDNSSENYNEPQSMKDALIDAGVPAEKIFCDYAGLRTLDSVIRAKKIFGQKSFVIISQKFHCERAVFLARAHGIEAYGFAAANNPPFFYKVKLWFRERFARVLAVSDIVFGRTPKYLGEPISLD